MFWELLLISLGIQVLLFIPAYLIKTDKLTDLSYSLTFVILAGLMYLRSDQDILKLILFLMVAVWGFRLGYYLVKRIWKIGKDKRFDDIRINLFKFLSFWVFQGAVIPLVLVPSMLFFNLKTSFSVILVFGFLVWLAGFLVETFSDLQKYKFINNPKNKGKWVNTGLWKISRHPNYFGEILCWVGIYFYTFSSLVGTQKLIALISPLTISTILLFISGIPKLEKKADKKWGSDKNYQEYKRKTAVLIPFIY